MSNWLKPIVGLYFWNHLTLGIYSQHSNLETIFIALSKSNPGMKMVKLLIPTIDAYILICP